MKYFFNTDNILQLNFFQGSMVRSAFSGSFIPLNYTDVKGRLTDNQNLLPNMY